MNTSESSVEVEVIESHDALGSSKHNFPKREQNYQSQHQSRRGNISDDKNDDQIQTSNQSESEKKPATNFSTSNKGPLTEDSRIRAMPIAKEGNINTVVEEKNPPVKTMCKTEFPMNDDNDKNQKDSLIHHSIRFRGGKNNQELENETAKPAHNFHRNSSVTTSSNYHWESGDVTCGVENSCNNFVSTELSSCLSISNKNEKKELPHEVITIDDDSLDEDPGERIPSADEASTNSKLQIPTSVGWSKEKKIVDGVVQVNKKVFQQIRQKGTMPASVPEGGKKDASAFVDPTLTLLGAFKSISDNTSQCALASDADDTHASLKRKWQEFGKLSAISERKTRKLEVSCLNPLSGRGDTFGLSQLENQTLLASVGACRTNSSTSSLSASLASTTTCTLQDVRPSFSQTTITFLNQRAGINTVDELCNANDSTLCVCLMAFNGFKLACAMEAWRSKQRFRNLYRLRLAKKTILKWKRIAEAFMASLDKKPIRVANENEHGVSDNAWDSSSAEDEVGHDKSIQRNTQKIPNDRLSIEGSLRSILSSHETAILEQHFGIYTASQLVEADKPNFISRLSVVMRNNGFEDRPRREVQCLCEGMLHSWLWRATEVANQHESEKSTISESSSSSYKEPVCNLPDHLPTSCSEDIQCSFATPMSFVDLLFVRSQNMSSDEQLISLDVENLDLAQRYTHFLRKKHKIVPIEEAKAAMKSWRDDACRVLEGSNVANLTETFQTTRLDLNAICSGPGRQKVMDNVFHICKTVVDETNDGFPVRTIVTYDFSNSEYKKELRLLRQLSFSSSVDTQLFSFYDAVDVLYEFEVRIRDSQCGPGAGKGAFLTYK